MNVADRAWITDSDVRPETAGRKESGYASAVPAVKAERLPLHDLLAQLGAWQTDRSAAQRERVVASLDRVLEAYGAEGAYVSADLPPAAPISLGAGSLAGFEAPPQSPDVVQRGLSVHGVPSSAAANLWVSGRRARVDELAEAIELALAATWSSQETIAQREQLEALDTAVRGIASIDSADRVLQLIVDRVRELAGAEYAALGIVGPFGRIEQFLTSGISGEQRAALGPPPRGHGLLGLIIREDRSFLIDDIVTDDRRYGFPPHHPEMHSFLGVPVHSKGRSIGNLYLTNKQTARAFSDRRPAARRAFRAACRDRHRERPAARGDRAAGNRRGTPADQPGPARFDHPEPVRHITFTRGPARHHR